VIWFIEYKNATLRYGFSLKLSIWPNIYSASLWSQHTLITLCHSHQSSNHLHHSKLLIAPSDMFHLIFGTSFLHHSEFIQIIHPLSATCIWTCRFNLLRNAITFRHFFIVSLWTQNWENLILHHSLFVSDGLISWSRSFCGFLCLSVLCFSYPYVLQTYVRQLSVNAVTHANILIDWLIDWQPSFVQKDGAKSECII